jgi:hypothetical protein
LRSESSMVLVQESMAACFLSVTQAREAANGSTLQRLNK